MRATTLSKNIWNAIGDLANQNRSPREIFLQKVIKRDAESKLVWTEEFGQLAIPIFGFDYLVEYIDSADTSVVRRTVVATAIVPAINDLVVIVDMWGAQRFPVCLGKMISTGKFWEPQ